MGNAGKPVDSSSSKEEEDAKAKKPKMHLERKRRKEEDMKVLSDLSDFQNLAAMLEAERFRKKKKMRRKKKKENISMENARKSVVSSITKEEKDVKTKKPKIRLERKRIREKEMKVLSELSDFQNLAAMMEAERSRKKKKRRRKKKKENVEVGAQEDGAVNFAKEEEQVDSAKDVESNNLLLSENVVPQKPLDLSFTIDERRMLQKAKKQCKQNEEVIDVEKGQEQPDTVRAVTTTKALETGSVLVSESITTEKLFASTCKIDEERTSQEAKKKCTKNEEVMSSLDEFKMLSDLSNFKNLAAMMEAEAFMRSKQRKKRRKKKTSREFEAPFQRNLASNCFAYGRSQHTSSCPEENEGNCLSSMICLRCGASGHDMLLCRNKYSSDDLKEI